MKEELLTFDELLKQGYAVRKGQRHVAQTKYGEALFTRSQCDEDPYHNNPQVGNKKGHLLW